MLFTDWEVRMEKKVFDAQTEVTGRCIQDFLYTERSMPVKARLG